MLRKHTLTLSLAKPHTLTVAISTGSTPWFMFFIRNHWTFSPHAVPQSKRHRPFKTSDLWMPLRYLPEAITTQYQTFIISDGFSQPRLPKVGALRSAAARRDDADGGEGVADDGGPEKRWVGIYMCSRAKGKSDQMSQSKCFALMTSPEESCGAAR